jgi:HNH endonuclease
MDSRPPIPAALKRQVLVEAGHRCAVPTCRQTPVDIHHIVFWENRQDHEFENLIALCPTCHRRVHTGEIDKKSVNLYKHNLSVLNSRYGEYEQRVLQHFVDNPEEENIRLPFGQHTDILLMYLVRDKLLIPLPDKRPVSVSSRGQETLWYGLTEKGKLFISHWKFAQDVDELTHNT